MIKYCFTTAFKITNFTLLEDRALISLQGSDVWQLLQGIATNDIVKYQHSKEQSIYTAFLNTQGRIICDAILIKPLIMKAGEWIYNKDELWIDVEYHQKKIFKDNLKKYLIRKKVEINHLNDLHILGIYSELMKHEDSLGSSINQDQDGEIEDGDYKNQVFSDPRLQLLGLRIITDNYEQIEMDPTSLLIQNQDVYKAYRYSKGILEGSEIANQLPFSVNLDFYNGINLQKGCYVGQELAARSYHTGVIRKRCLPVAILSKDDNFDYLELKEQPSLQKENIYLGDQVVGQMLQSQYNFGVAYLKYLDIDINAQFKCKDHEIRFYPNKDLKKMIKDYKEIINSRQII